MNNIQSPLGKSLESMGVDALLAAADEPTYLPIINIPLDRITASRILQPRKTFNPEALSELAKSITEHGVLQPILVRSAGIDQYEIIAGERRFQASKLAEQADIPCILKEVTDSEGIALAIIENVQRDSLNPIDAAEALSILIDRHQYTHVSLAKTLGKSRSSISNLIRLLNLTPAVKDMVTTNQLDMGHARALLPLKPDIQALLAKKIVDNRLSVRATEKLVQTFSAPKVQQSYKEEPVVNPGIQTAFPKLSIQVNKNGHSGHIKIPFKNQDQLAMFMSQFEKMST
ncbi:ParB/RepB/Spo0J family partition protein [Gammaproteobacteria bacterium]|nr:ParB/RepB/Spo0J family partition protein [Gammaproteobacteria bacterium]